MRIESSESRCDLCQRRVPPRLITLHHLKPKSRGGTAEHRVPLCKPCHKQVHATFDNKTLDRELSQLEHLRQHPLLQPFLKWIRKQPPESLVQTRMSSAHAGKGRVRIRRRSR
jgi:hypothetical protein